ncbi:MAG TPA: hypothetical protein VM597_23555 [Gemmataceae bacterium]|nr:hypothetical protein [Gemmataceae bacterium]
MSEDELVTRSLAPTPVMQPEDAEALRRLVAARLSARPPRRMTPGALDALQRDLRQRAGRRPTR